MITIRIGDGQTASGKILDGSTEWYTDKEFDHAIEAALKTHKTIYPKEHPKKQLSKPAIHP